MLQPNVTTIPPNITHSNLLLLARNESTPFATRVEATERLREELPFVSDNVRAHYEHEIAAVRAALGVREIKAYDDIVASMVIETENLRAKVEELEKRVATLEISGSPAPETPADNLPAFSLGGGSTPPSVTGTNYEGPATTLTVQNGIVTKIGDEQ
jgi:hypothetical protein